MEGKDIVSNFLKPLSSCNWKKGRWGIFERENRRWLWIGIVLFLFKNITFDLQFLFLLLNDKCKAT